jgi:uncharacterized protein (TIGR02996 family)
MIEDAFLQSVIESPDDDTPRLVYADWLMEQDDRTRAARAEFIQVQCAIDRGLHPERDWRDWIDAALRMPALRQRERALLAEFGGAWRGPLSSIPCLVELSRGFVEAVTIADVVLERHADTLFWAAPVRRLRVNMTGYNPNQFRDFAAPYWSQVEHLEFNQNYLSDGHLARLTASPGFARLRSLSLRRGRFSDAGAAALADWPRLAQLELLDLRDNYSSLDTLRRLVQSPHWNPRARLRVSWLRRHGESSFLRMRTLPRGEIDLPLFPAYLDSLAEREHPVSGRACAEMARDARHSGEPRETFLTKRLRDPRPRQRILAATFLARLGAGGTGGVPELVRRLNETGASVVSAANAALARLVPELPRAAQRWLCLFASPSVEPERKLAQALESEQLPPAVAEAFAELWKRRAAWWMETIGAVPSAGVRITETPRRALASAARALATAVGKVRAQKVAPVEQVTCAAAARDNEMVWMMGRLCDLLLAHHGSTSPGSDPVAR